MLCHCAMLPLISLSSTCPKRDNAVLTSKEVSFADIGHVRRKQASAASKSDILIRILYLPTWPLTV